MIKTAIAALAAAPLFAGAAMAGPYVESKTTGGLTDGDWTATQTELRIGYEETVGNGVKLYGEVGPGYEWNNGGADEAVAVGEIGVHAPLADNLSLKAKVTGEYGDRSDVFALGGELKVRYAF
ncbi:DUF680 domain-containing protein [Synechococcus phage S-SZBM1]|uniref:DUF680 domain-containing protein n=1 Tax=Synechococcus phage S-SZBM1 TaxID=2926475 RepID=A0AC61TSK0_9CAUD|nr:DUF680 domain-containing protein [Synechococcus phage S-SZBM1]UNH61207.1 DUF680 domain-containing protein [Synechococcus phage S-SZBM1]